MLKKEASQRVVSPSELDQRCVSSSSNGTSSSSSSAAAAVRDAFNVPPAAGYDRLTELCIL
ncbi:MAG: hypothetical protein WBL67_17595 [Nitrososphaeraceae archaeon]